MAAKKVPSTARPAKKAPAKKSVAKSPAKSTKKAPTKKVPVKTTKKTSGKQAAEKTATPKKAALRKAAPAQSTPAAGEVQEGARAPSFSLADQSGNVIRSSDLRGAPYVLYFYPKDSTPGCTREACDFRDQFPSFTRRKVRIFGVSPDSAKSHTGFIDKHGLPFPLLVDADKELAQAYGVWAKKQNYGREYWGIVRSTFLIDAAGKVKKAWRNVRVAGHAEEVLAEAEGS